MLVIFRKILVGLMFCLLLSGCPNLLQEGMFYPPDIDYYEPYKHQTKFINGTIGDECIRQTKDIDGVLGVVKNTFDSNQLEYFIETKSGLVSLTIYKKSYDVNKYRTVFALANYHYTRTDEMPRDIYYKEKDRIENYLEELLSKIVKKCLEKDS